MRAWLPLVFIVGLFCGCDGGGNATDPDAANVAEFNRLVQENGDELKAGIERIAHLAELLDQEPPPLALGPRNLQIVNLIGNEGNTFIDLQSGIMNLNDPEFDVRQARDIYSGDAGGLRPFLRPVFFSSALLELRAAFDDPSLINSAAGPTTFRDALDQLRRAEYLIVLQGYVRQPRVYRPGEAMGDSSSPFSRGMVAPDGHLTHFEGSAEMTLTLIDIKQGVVLGAVEIKAQNSPQEERTGPAGFAIADEMKEELEKNIRREFELAVKKLAVGEQSTPPHEN